jgi:hypothetical protein
MWTDEIPPGCRKPSEHVINSSHDIESGELAVLARDIAMMLTITREHL